MEWTVEEIPDEDALFFRIHYYDIDDSSGQPKPGAFRNSPKKVPGAGMSTNWAKYSTSENVRENANKPAGEYTVIRLIAGNIRKIPGQTVVHEPLSDNQSHSEVFGEKNTEVRAKFLQIYEIELTFNPAVKAS